MGASREPIYPMGVARRLTGLSERQIRYWEQRGVLTPARSAGGHRLYSQSDLDFLRKAAAMRQQGYDLEEIMRSKTAADRMEGDTDADAHFRSQPNTASGSRRLRSGTSIPRPGNFPATTHDRAKILIELDRRREEIRKKERD